MPHRRATPVQWALPLRGARQNPNLLRQLDCGNCRIPVAFTVFTSRTKIRAPVLIFGAKPSNAYLIHKKGLVNITARLFISSSIIRCVRWKHSLELVALNVNIVWERFVGLLVFAPKLMKALWEKRKQTWMAGSQTDHQIKCYIKKTFLFAFQIFLFRVKPGNFRGKMSFLYWGAKNHGSHSSIFF